MNYITIKTLKTPIGEYLIGEYDNKLCLFDCKYRKMRRQIDFRIQNGLNSKYHEGDHDIFLKFEKQFDEYLHKKRENFDIPLITIGSSFQKSVWKTLQSIPYSKTETYLSLAHKLGNPKAVRAVAGANGANAIAIIIPCHRVINNNGSLGGFAGGLSVKRKLLDLENQLLLNFN